MLQSRLRSLRPIGAAAPVMTQAQKQSVLDLWISKGLAPAGSVVTPPSAAELAAYGPQTTTVAAPAAPATGFFQDTWDYVLVGSAVGAVVLVYLGLHKKKRR